MATYQSLYTGAQIDDSIGKVQALSTKSIATEQQVAPVETSYTASRAYAVGACFCMNGLLYRVTLPISAGGTIAPGTNCTNTTAAGRPQISLLWTNSDASADFAAQTIVSGSDLMAFSMVLIAYRANKGDSVMQTAIIPIDGYTYDIVGMKLPATGSAAQGVRRTFAASLTNGLVCQAGNVKNLEDGTKSEDNGFVVPRFVYGIS